MKKNRNKNYTMYWFVAISGVMTIPAAIIIIKNLDGGNLLKTIAIVLTFVILLFAIIFLYKIIFGVSVQEITSEEKVTELDRIDSEIEKFAKQYRNPQIVKGASVARSQIQKFKRRRNVLLQVAGVNTQEDESGAITDIIQTVEDALAVNMERLANRIEIFDDEGSQESIRQNLDFVNEQIKKSNEILMEFETLITEMSRIGEVKQEKDISKLRDMVNAMQSLNQDSEDEIDDLTKKYEGEMYK